MALPEDMVQQEAQKRAQEQQNAITVYLQKRFGDDVRDTLSRPSGRRTLFAFMRDGQIHGSIAAGQGAEFRLGIREAACNLRRVIASVDPMLPARMELEWLALVDEAPKPEPGAPTA